MSHSPSERITIFYYTGTGNSLWTARTLARLLGNTELISITKGEGQKEAVPSSVIGLVFPVHMWGVPRRVLDFLEELKTISPAYVFAVAVNAGQVSNTLVQLQEVLAAKGVVLSGGWSLRMPSNYLPWGGPGPLEEQNKRFHAAREKVSSIAGKIRGRVKMPVEKGPLWQRVVFTRLYKVAYPNVLKMDKGFWVDERCNQCVTCVNICPTQNIELQNEKLTWLHHCEQCLACIQWCPQEALQYGKKSATYSRYHHPEVRLKDMLN